MKQPHILHTAALLLPIRSWQAGTACIAQLVGGLANDAGPHSHHHLVKQVNKQQYTSNTPYKHDTTAWSPGGLS
jgi:hypothetical protein